MEISTLALLSGALLLSMVLLTGLCLHCRRHSAPFIIQPNHGSEDYTQQTQPMRVIRSYQGTIGTNWATQSSTLSPVSEQIVRHNSFTPTENESNPSYENPTEAQYQNTVDEDEEYEQAADAPYVDVLPDPPMIETHQSNQSLASTQSSEPPYVNIEREQENYQNVDPHLGMASRLSCLEDSDEDSDEETGNYVNQDMMCLTETSI
ncbi:linker for activation of T-cells family member 1 [Osmerus mordax]|uniref:linker for activation of T-cells family member 1 n=1 Tax=Osmerus mordax TaxID=8014 RepID=UPI003510535F